MTFREKLDAALADLADRGVKPADAAPLVYHLLWAVGVKALPPLYQTAAGKLAVFTPVLWAAIAGPVGLILFVAAGARSGLVGAAYALLPAAVYAAVVTAIYRHKARKLGLPRWDEFDPFGPDEADGW